MAENKKLFRNKELLIIFGIALLGTFFLFRNTEFLAGNIKSDLRNIKIACEKLQNKETCYAKAFENLTRETDWNHSFAVLHELQKIEPESRGCHFIAHSISSAETRKNPSRWKEIMNSAPQDCSYGAAHGALEVYASTFPDGKLPKSEIPNICNNPDSNNCTHILGHLLLIMSENNIGESLGECSTLPHNEWSKFECYTGVFMERITAFNLVAHGLAKEDFLNWPARVPELEALCREQFGVNSVACWKEIVHVVVVKFDNNSQKIFDFCETAPGETETRQCIDHALGIIGGGYNFQLSEMMSICDSEVEAADFKNRCYAQLVAATLSTIPQEVPAAVKFCGNIPEAYQSSCFTTIGNSLYLAKPEYKNLLAKECAGLPEEFENRCENGGDSGVIFYAGN